MHPSKIGQALQKFEAVQQTRKAAWRCMRCSTERSISSHADTQGSIPGWIGSFTSAVPLSQLSRACTNVTSTPFFPLFYERMLSEIVVKPMKAMSPFTALQQIKLSIITASNNSTEKLISRLQADLRLWEPTV